VSEGGVPSRRVRGLIVVASVIAGGVLAWAPVQEMRARDIVAALRSPDVERQRGARDAIHHLPPLSARAAAVFASALRDPDWGTREAAAGALAQLGRFSAAQVPDLITALADEDDRVKASAAAALGSIGPAAGSSESALRDLMAFHSGRATDHSVLQYSRLPRVQAAWALGEIGARSPETIVALRRAGIADDAFLSKAAKQALANLGAR
jgi:HEAT repeat protein